jgi:hypothetical protein
LDYDNISRTVARLRAELNQIELENRSYFRKKNHKERETLNQRQRADRVQEIKAELERLMTQKIA